MSEFLDQFKAARRVSTPIIAVNTADPAAAVEGICQARSEAPNDGDKKPIPQLQWNVASGVEALNTEGAQAFSAISQGADSTQFRGPAGLVEILEAFQNAPAGLIAFVLNAHRFIDDAAVSQAAWNLRDTFKTKKSTLALLSPGLVLPAELQQDVLILDEPLPDADQLRAIVVQQYKNAAVAYPGRECLDNPDPKEVESSINALRGLAAFPADQASAMCLTLKGMNIPRLWERKRRMIQNTPGLSVWQGGETFDDIGGCQNIIGFLRRVLTGRSSPRAIAFIDEIEKSLAGASGPAADSSGVSQDYLGQLLAYMQDKKATGCILVGPPGSGKSMVAKAAGSSVGIPTIQLDLGGMKGSLVGASEQNLRQALKVISAVSDDSALFLATCNSLAILPPELRRRFTFGIFFFDLPDEEERANIWKIYVKRYELTDTGVRPDDDGWTGAEIRQCCDLAWRLGCDLAEAAQYIVPVSKSSAEVIVRLRQSASGRFIDASKPGLYQMKVARVAYVRQVELEEKSA